MHDPTPRTIPSAFSADQQLAAVDDVLHVEGPRGLPLPGLDPGAPPLLEVAQIWSGIVLAVQHFDRERPAIRVGDRPAGRGAPDFFVSSSGLPSDSWPLVEQDARGTHVNYLAGSAGFLRRGDERVDPEALVASGRARAVGAHLQITLGEGERFVADVGHAATCV